MTIVSLAIERKCPQCGIIFQTYDDSKLFHNKSCMEEYHRIKYKQFLADRKAKREHKSPMLCRKKISCLNCNHYKIRCEGKETEKQLSTLTIKDAIRGW